MSDELSVFESNERRRRRFGHYIVGGLLVGFVGLLILPQLFVRRHIPPDDAIGQMTVVPGHQSELNLGIERANSALKFWFRATELSVFEQTRLSSSGTEVLPSHVSIWASGPRGRTLELQCDVSQRENHELTRVASNRFEASGYLSDCQLSDLDAGRWKIIAALRMREEQVHPLESLDLVPILIDFRE